MDTHEHEATTPATGPRADPTTPTKAPAESGTEMDACLDAAADAAGAARSRWQATDGPDSGVGLDWWFVHRDRERLFMRVNLDQWSWSWEAQDESDPGFVASGQVEAADAGEDSPPDPD